MHPYARPRWHFTPPSAWMNDPNGLVYHEGEYHLFYQYHPHSLVWGPMHWGHAVSSDLVHWEPLPVALEPDALGAIFSGSAVWDGQNTSGLVPGGGLIAVFSFDTQAQGLAFSSDRGRTWTKYSGNPVIPALAKDFRDPKVFWDEDHWSLVLAAGDHLEFFRSANLRDWTKTGRFDAALDVGVWECPDLFPLPTPSGDQWVLLLSVGDKAVNGGSGTLYWVGVWDGASFLPTSGPTWLDGGTDNYAGVTWNGTPGRLFVGWMNNWRYARQTPAERWRGAMTLPRSLSLEGPWLRQEPVAALTASRTQNRPLATGKVNQSLILGPVDVSSDTKLHLQTGTRALEVVWQWGKSELVLGWDAAAGLLTLDRHRAGEVAFHPDFGQAMTATLKKPGNDLTLRIILDGTSIEVFAEEGLTVLTALVFPPAGDPLVLIRTTGTARVLGAYSWTLSDTEGRDQNLTGRPSSSRG